MNRLAASLLALLSLTAPALAACSGTALTETLTAEQRAAVDARLAETPYPQGNHWRATRGGDVVHLIGTMHLTDPRLDGPAGRLRPVIEGADLLLVEMASPEKQEFETAMKGRPEMVVLSEGSLPDMMAEADWQALSAAMETRGLPPFVGARMQPWLISMLMAIPPCLDSATATEDGMDVRLESFAVEAGVPVRSLEPHETAFRIFNETPMAVQLSMVRSTLVGPQVAEDLFETMMHAYFTENHAEIFVAIEVLTPEISPLTEAENDQVTAMMQDRLLAERNHRWLPVILQAVEDMQGPVVAAFGAGHLSGEEGVLRLLEREGFTLERQAF